jgi:hypothetical protein
MKYVHRNDLIFSIIILLVEVIGIILILCNVPISVAIGLLLLFIGDSIYKIKTKD